MPRLWKRSAHSPLPAHPRRRRRARLALLFLLLGFAAFLVPTISFFRTMTGAMAVTNATALITQTVSDIVDEKMRQLEGGGAAFVSFEKDTDGNITAIVTDAARVNILSSELLTAVVEASNAGDMDLYVPLGDLLGMSLLLGKGPKVPVEITLLTSSRVNFRNALTDAGINQTKHQLLLVVQVDADVLLPWEICSTRIVNEVLVAETVIVGHVPETYVRIGE